MKPIAAHPDPPIETEPAQLLQEAWHGDDAAGARGSPAGEGLLDIAGFAGAATLAPQEAICLAVFGPHDELAHGEPAFVALFPDATAMPDLRRLTAAARRRGEALGLMEAADGHAVAALAVSGEDVGRWAPTEAARSAMARAGRVLVLVFAPSRSSELAARAADAFGLTPLEARVAEAFLSAPSLAIAAAQSGVGRETARDAMERVMAKTGVSRSNDVVRKLIELMSGAAGETRPSAAVMQAAFGLTPSEAGVAAQLAAGATQKAAAQALGLRPETVRTYAKAVLAKTGAARTKDLVRLATETGALSRLAAAAEPVFTREGPPARLRLIPRDAGRAMAFLDYGPRSGRPAIVFHGFVAGRSLPPALAQRLQAHGYRPIVPQRPGFGLTSPARQPYLVEAREDLAALVEQLGAPLVALFARDGGVAAALAFASAHPQRIARGVLLNPRSPAGISRHEKTGPIARMTRLMLSRPQVIGPLGEFLRRRTRSEFLEMALRESLKALPTDLAALDERAVRAQLVRDIQAQFAQGCEGYVAEHSLYTDGWRPPQVPGGGPWTVLHSGAFGRVPRRDPWSGLPGVRFETLAGAGVLAQFTHARALADLIAGDA